MDKASADCAKFKVENSAMLAYQSNDCNGHDFWLTRNGHGSGFWDRDLPHGAGRVLTDAAHRFGECDLYRGDNGQLFLS